MSIHGFDLQNGRLISQMHLAAMVVSTRTIHFRNQSYGGCPCDSTHDTAALEPKGGSVMLSATSMARSLASLKNTGDSAAYVMHLIATLISSNFYYLKTLFVPFRCIQNYKQMHLWIPNFINQNISRTSKGNKHLEMTYLGIFEYTLQRRSML